MSEGFPKPGDWMIFTGRNGSDREQAECRKFMQPGAIIQVESIEIGAFHSSIRPRGFAIDFNSVMFEPFDLALQEIVSRYEAKSDMTDDEGIAWHASARAALNPTGDIGPTADILSAFRETPALWLDACPSDQVVVVPRGILKSLLAALPVSTDRLFTPTLDMLEYHGAAFLADGAARHKHEREEREMAHGDPLTLPTTKEQLDELDEYMSKRAHLYRYSVSTIDPDRGYVVHGATPWSSQWGHGMEFCCPAVKAASFEEALPRMMAWVQTHDAAPFDELQEPIKAKVLKATRSLGEMLPDKED